MHVYVMVSISDVVIRCHFVLLLEYTDRSCLCLLDLSAAFDTNDHNILLTRLSSWFGIQGTALNRFRSYQSSHYFRVKCNNNLSSLNTCLCGVPRGSFLGPLLCYVYNPYIDIRQTEWQTVKLQLVTVHIRLCHMIRKMTLVNKTAVSEVWNRMPYHNEVCCWFVTCCDTWQNENRQCCMYLNSQCLKCAFHNTHWSGLLTKLGHCIPDQLVKWTYIQKCDRVRRVCEHDSTQHSVRLRRVSNHLRHVP